MRGKAIEMVRRGESSQAIATALSVARPEVEFLMRLEAAARKD
jgi:predicted XRE-type DNA-binding protein